MVQGSNPTGDKIFCTHPDLFWGPPNLLYKGYQVPFPGEKQQGMALTTHPQLAPRLKEEESYTSTPTLGLHGLF